MIQSLRIWTIVGLLAIGASVVGLGCQFQDRAPTPTAAGVDPSTLIDPKGYGDSPGLPVARDLFRVGERIRVAQRPDKLPARKTCLCLSGGGSFGVFQAGLIVGWTEAGNRPAFDSVTGISTGALVAGLAFLGPDYDGELRRVYTTLKTEDIYTRKRPIQALLSDSLADNTPLARQIDRVVTPEAVCRLAAEHRKGRRLYISTTDLEGRRAVVWDIGAIADKAEPGASELIARLFLASAAIPAFFPPVEITVDVDGQRLTERHVDGGITQNIFFRPPQVPPELRLRPPSEFLAGSDLYAVVAGKLYADAEAVRLRALKVATASVSTLIYAETRAELVKLYTTCMIAGMNYHLAAIPEDFPAPTDATEFEPATMKRLFDEGYRQAITGTAWRNSPPGTQPRESLAQRSSIRLTRQPINTPPTPTAEMP